MNHLLAMLSGGDLRSDGLANEVVDIVLGNDQLFDDLYEGMAEADDVVRGRTADALEKIARSRLDLLDGHLSDLVRVGKSDEVPMVRWHIAMILGYFAIEPGRVDEIFRGLMDMLDDRSVFTRSWVIVSLSIVGRLHPQYKDEITIAIANLQRDDSGAIRTKVRMALALLADDDLPFPSGWLKSVQPVVRRD